MGSKDAMVEEIMETKGALATEKIARSMCQDQRSHGCNECILKKKYKFFYIADGFKLDVLLDMRQ